MTPRIPPKNGSVFAPGQVMRLEFPAQGYVNPLNTTLEFDVTLYGYTTSTYQTVRFQNSISSIFSRVRLMYGATPLEDIINYNVIVRALTNWTATKGDLDQTSIAEGWGTVVWGSDALSANSSAASTVATQGLVNVRQKYIQGISSNNLNVNTAGTSSVALQGVGFGSVPQTADLPGGVTGNGTTPVTRRYQINFALGLFTQDKLIPTKFMASQLAIEMTLEQSSACIYSPVINTTTGAPTYGVGNINLIPEILEFDASYDEMFLRGLTDGGVPIKFSSWHTFLFSSASSSNVNLQVQERSRSVKALFCVQRRQTPLFGTDSHAFFFDTASASTTNSAAASTLQNFQFRIGGRYFPASPVQTSTNVGSANSNGGAEAYIELAKALNIVGDYRLATSTNASNFAVCPGAVYNAGAVVSNGIAVLPEFDFTLGEIGQSSGGYPVYQIYEGTTNSFAGTSSSGTFAMATDLETSNGIEISGLNAEEQSDISLIANWKLPQVTGSNGFVISGNTIVGSVPSSLEVYTFYDAMIVLKPNNVVELIQ